MLIKGKNKKVENNDWKREVPDEQIWQENKVKFDPDSSPEAWKHFREYYTTEHWAEIKDYDLGNLSFYFFEKTNNFYTYKNKYKLDEYNRLYALSNEAVMELREKGHFSPCKRLSGDTDFDFKEGKYKKFKTIMEKEKNYETPKYKDAFKMLNDCKDMHHTLLNFSLMQSMGNLQRFKEDGLFLNGKYEHLDRLDTLIYYLDKYYKIDEIEKRENSEIMNRLKRNKDGSPNSNYKILKVYLDTFIDIYDYCYKIYFITIDNEEKDENDFIQKLIKLGGKELESINDVIEYMELALQFWERKQNYFESMS